MPRPPSASACCTRTGSRDPKQAAQWYGRATGATSVAVDASGAGRNDVRRLEAQIETLRADLQAKQAELDQNQRGLAEARRGLAQAQGESQTTRAEVTDGSISTPTQRPLPRTSVMILLRIARSRSIM